MEDLNGIYVFMGGLLFCGAITILVILCGHILHIYEYLEVAERVLLYGV